MDNYHGEKMAEIHLRYNRCQTLTDEECIALRDWLKQTYEYNLSMEHRINAVYFGSQYESLDKVCESRHIK